MTDEESWKSSSLEMAFHRIMLQIYKRGYKDGLAKKYEKGTK